MIISYIDFVEISFLKNLMDQKDLKETRGQTEEARRATILQPVEQKPH